MRSDPPQLDGGARPDWFADVADQEVDAGLVLRIQNADQSALGSLYDRWVDHVYSVASHVLGGDDDADDVVEWTFTKVWTDAHRYDSARGSVGAWIVIIARSYSMTRRRSESRRLRNDEARTAYLVDEASFAAASPLQNTEQNESRTLINGAMEQLPDDQQRVLQMSYFDGMSQSEIASKLGVPLGTVKTRVRLALAKLRGSLGDLRDRDR